MKLTAPVVPSLRGPRARSLAGCLILLGSLCAMESDAVADLPVSASASAETSLYKLYPAGSIQSFEAADQALVAAARERTNIEARFGVDERACHPKFFATSCLEDAKERRRADLAKVRTVEVEAKSFKRHARVAERDQALQERREEEEAEAPQRLQEQIEHEARAARKAQSGAATTPPVTPPAQDAPTGSGNTREAQHDAKLQQRQTMEIANAKKRAENVSAYRKKVEEAAAHQREIAAKQAEKERENSARAASKP
jgi:colicin import membrane protein